MKRLQTLFILTRATMRNFQDKRYVSTAKRLITGGFSLSVALPFFSSTQPVKITEDDTSKPKNFDIIVREADALYDNYLIENAYIILKKWESSVCSELLWRLARVLCEKAKLSEDKKKKTSLMYEAFAVVQKAIENEPKDGCFGAHKWYAILLNYIAEMEGSKSRLQKSREVKEHLERALQICPGDATTWHILGESLLYTHRIVLESIRLH